MEKLVINKDEPIIPQLEKFKKDKNVYFTALDYLKKPEDIKRFFEEAVINYQKYDPAHPDAREAVWSNLARVAGYGLDDRWNRFHEVLKSEFDAGIKQVREELNKKLRKTHYSISIKADKGKYSIETLADSVQKDGCAPRYGAFTLNNFYEEIYFHRKDISGSLYIGNENASVRTILNEAKRKGFYKEFEIGEALLIAKEMLGFINAGYNKYGRNVMFMIKGLRPNEAMLVFSPEKDVVAVKISVLRYDLRAFKNFVFM